MMMNTKINTKCWDRRCIATCSHANGILRSLIFQIKKNFTIENFLSNKRRKNRLLTINVKKRTWVSLKSLWRIKKIIFPEKIENFEEKLLSFSYDKTLDCPKKFKQDIQLFCVFLALLIQTIADFIEHLLWFTREFAFCFFHFGSRIWNIFCSLSRWLK